MVTNNGFSTALSLNRHIGLVGTVPERVEGVTPCPELIGKGNGSQTIFFTSKQYLIENTEILSTNAGTSLTRTTDYTMDYDDGIVTLTAAGVTALGTDDLQADEYKYNDNSITNTEIIKALNASENKVLRRTEQAFADFTATDPAYRKVLNEQYNAAQWRRGKVYETIFQPIVEIRTTVNGAYTTGGATITVTDGTGLPNAATIYIGGNKVAYTARSGNDLTVPTSTPSIADGVKVRNEVVEVSNEAEGNEPVFRVLDPDTDFTFDYYAGKFELLDRAWFGELQNSDVRFPSYYLVRTSYLQAWHEQDNDPEIPEDIEEVTNMIAAKKFTQRMVKKAHITGQNDFNPSALNSGDVDINETLMFYRTLDVGSSPANKTDLS